VANDALSRERKVHLLSPGYEQSIARSGGSDTPRGDFKNVVLITLESLSTHYANDATTMPFWSQFSNQWCLSLTNYIAILVFYKLNSAIERGTKPDA
jgi:hypothetical protein